jgi:predicted phage baseplate assembly protein
MALEVSVDTLDFDALVAEAQRRIIPRTRGQWTLHAPVDPGITLIELYAWLLDQRSYWANHNDGDFGRALLRLLGDAPRPARAACVPLVVEADAVAQIEAGTQVRFAPAGTALWFAMQGPLTALPLAAIPFGLRSDGVDLTLDLRSGRSVDVMASSGGASRVEIDVVLSAALTAAAPNVGIAIAIDTADDVEPEWSPDATTAPPPATLAFAYRTATGWSSLAVTDGTGGLRRPGLLRFALPADAAPIVAATTWTYTIALATAAATYTAPPRVMAIAPNAVVATHAIATTYAVPVVPVPLPGAAIELPAPPIESTVKLSVVELDGATYAWQPTADFTTAAPGDRVFVVDRARSAVRFGDGLDGRLLCAKQVTATFVAGGGTAGNAGLGNWYAAGNQFEATSFAPAIGGRDSEALADAEARVTIQLKDRTRAATVADYAVIATTTPGVAIARGFAAIGFDPDQPCLPAPGVVTVFVVPGVPDRTADDLRGLAAPVTDPGALAAVVTRFASTRLLGTEVDVQTARYRDVAVRVALTGDPWDPATTRANIEAAIRARLDPLLGGDELDGWPFGNPVRPSDLLRVAQLAAAEDGEVTSVGVALDGSSTFEVCGDVALRSYELPDVTSVEIDITPEGAS